MALISLAQARTLIADAAFQERATLLAVRVALRVSDEAVDVAHPNVTAKRCNLALSWVSDRNNGFVGCLVRNIALDMNDAQHAAIQTDDVVLTNVIKNVFNAMAGVTPADKA